MRISEKPENIHKFNKEIEKEFLLQGSISAILLQGVGLEKERKRFSSGKEKF